MRVPVRPKGVKNGPRMSPADRARGNPQSRALAIRAKCWDCQGGDADPSTQWRIGNCTADQCPLWPVRPWQRMAGRPIPKGLA